MKLVLRFLWVLTLMLASCPLALPSLRAADLPNEYELKAVMLFNLARFVQWPANAFADAQSPVVIGILGRNPFGDKLEQAVQGEKVNGRPIVIEYCGSIADLKPCHIVFICANEKPRLLQILAKLRGQPTLSVSEIEGFSRLPGGMVRFYTNDQKKIRLRLNLESARAEGLTISSKLIQVAELERTSSRAPGVPSWPGAEVAAAFFPRP